MVVVVRGTPGGKGNVQKVRSSQGTGVGALRPDGRGFRAGPTTTHVKKSNCRFVQRSCVYVHRGRGEPWVFGGDSWVGKLTGGLRKEKISQKNVRTSNGKLL